MDGKAVGMDAIKFAIAQIMRRIDGATDVQLRSPPGTQLLQVHLKPDQLAYWGLQPAQVLTALQTAFR